MHSLTGGCHCGNLVVEVELSSEPSTYQPRACDCSFCRAHGAAWISDAKGSLALHVTDPSERATYRQGSEQAELVLCRRCGVMVCVLLQEDGKLFGAVNAKAFVGSAISFGAEICVSPQKLSPSDKRKRWQDLWFPRVAVR